MSSAQAKNPANYAGTYLYVWIDMPVKDPRHGYRMGLMENEPVVG